VSSLSIPKALIWDFNGTILDDLDLVLESINALIRSRSLKPLTADFHRAHFGFPIEPYYRSLGFDFTDEDFASLSEEYHEGYMKGLARARLASGSNELFALFRRHSVPQFILSAMEQSLLDRTVGLLGIEGNFRAVYGLGDLLARSKVDRGRELIREQGIAPEATYFIGDTDHDVEVAEALGVTPIVVAAGHQAPERFSEDRARVFTDLHELYRAFTDSGT
jgi:phosphoglycolate phosphatase